MWLWGREMYWLQNLGDWFGGNTSLFRATAVLPLKWCPTSDKNKTRGGGDSTPAVMVPNFLSWENMYQADSEEAVHLVGKTFKEPCWIKAISSPAFCSHNAQAVACVNAISRTGVQQHFAAMPSDSWCTEVHCLQCYNRPAAVRTRNLDNYTLLVCFCTTQINLFESYK